jgi:hypothetical protein
MSDVAKEAAASSCARMIIRDIDDYRDDFGDYRNMDSDSDFEDYLT